MIKFFPFIFIESSVAKFNTIDSLDLIVVMQAVVDFSDNHVETWAESTTGNNTGSDFLRSEEIEFSGSSSEVLLGVSDWVLRTEDRVG